MHLWREIRIGGEQDTLTDVTARHGVIQTRLPSIQSQARSKMAHKQHKCRQPSIPLLHPEKRVLVYGTHDDQLPRDEALDLGFDRRQLRSQADIRLPNSSKRQGIDGTETGTTKGDGQHREKGRQRGRPRRRGGRRRVPGNVEWKRGEKGAGQPLTLSRKIGAQPATCRPDLMV